MARTREHVPDPYPWNSGNEDMTAVEYCLDNGIRSFASGMFSRYSHITADAFHGQFVTVLDPVQPPETDVQRNLNSCS